MAKGGSGRDFQPAASNPHDFPLIELSSRSEDAHLRQCAARLVITELIQEQLNARMLGQVMNRMEARRTVAIVHPSREFVVATGGLDVIEDSVRTSGTIWDLVVTKTFRGAQLGSRLLGHLEGIGVAEGMDELSLWEARSARGYYSQFGWESQNVVSFSGAILHTKRLEPQEPIVA